MLDATDVNSGLNGLFLLIYAFLAGIVVYNIFLIIYETGVRRTLDTKGRVTRGFVTRLERKTTIVVGNAPTMRRDYKIDYNYEVNGAAYSNTQVISSDTYEWMEGRSVVPLEVTYLPENPRTARFLDDAARISLAIRRSIVAVMLFGFMLLMIHLISA